MVRRLPIRRYVTLGAWRRGARCGKKSPIELRWSNSTVHAVALQLSIYAALRSADRGVTRRGRTTARHGPCRPRRPTPRAAYSRIGYVAGSYVAVRRESTPPSAASLPRTARGRRAPARAGGALHIPGTHRLRHPRSPIRGAAARVRVSRNLRSLLLTRIGHMPYGYAALERWPVGALTVLGGRRKITTSNHKAR